MKRTLLSIALLLIAADLRAQGAAANAGQLRLNKCLVSLKDGREHEIPALVAGQLISLEVREGRDVEIGTVLGKIDDRQAQANKEERAFEVEAAREQAENDVNVQFAKASWRVAEQELKFNTEANKRVPGSVTQTEMLRAALNVEKARLQIQVAEMEQRIAKFTMGAKQARVKESEGIIDRSEIKAPVSGRIVEMAKQRGEWCEPGAMILKMVQLDVLRVEGFVNASQHDPTDINNRPVKVQVRLANNVLEEFEGKIVFVDPRVQAGGEYRIHAEVVNRMNRAQSQWLLRPGSDAQMVIDMRGGGLAPAQQPPAGQNAAPAQPMRR